MGGKKTDRSERVPDGSSGRLPNQSHPAPCASESSKRYPGVNGKGHRKLIFASETAADSTS